MLVIGLTGGIGSGKTTVAAILEHMGYPVFYSDKEAANLMNTDPEIQQFLAELTGEDLYTTEGLDRQRLANIVFNQSHMLEQLNARVHPLVRNRFAQWVGQQKEPLVFNEAAILFETGANVNFDRMIHVTAPTSLRIERVMQRDRVSKERVEQRMKHQWKDEQKNALADYLIVNDGSPILRQVEAAIQNLLSEVNG